MGKKLSCPSLGKFLAFSWHDEIKRIQRERGLLSSYSFKPNDDPEPVVPAIIMLLASLPAPRKKGLSNTGSINRFKSLLFFWCK